MPERTSRASAGLRGVLGGSGGIWLVGAQAAYMALGYALIVGLGRFLTVWEFGGYAIVMTILTWANIVLATGVPNVTTARLAAGDGDPAAVWAAAVRLQLVLAAVVAVALLAASPLLARLLGQPDLAGPLAIGALVVPGVAAIGLQLARLGAGFAFRRQGIAQVAWSATRAVGAIAAAAFGGLNAALGAIAVSVLPGLVVAGRSELRGGRPSEPLRGLLVAALGASAVSLLVLIAIGFDLLVVSRLLPDEAGLYAAAQNLARIPYLLAVPIAAIVLPTAARPGAALARHVETALLLALGSAAAIAANPDGLLRLVFGARFEAAADAVAILVAGTAGLGLVSVGAAVLIGRGDRRRPSIALAIGLGLGVPASIPLVGALGLRGAALGTLIAALAAGAVGILLLARAAPDALRGVRIPRVLAVVIAVGAVVLAVPGHPLLGLAAAGALALALARVLGLLPRGGERPSADG